MTTGRETILARIREALRAPARPHLSADTPSRPSPSHDSHPAREWLPPVPGDHQGRVQLFAENATALKAEFQRLPSLESARLWLHRRAVEAGWKRLAVHPHDLTHALATGFPGEILWIEAQTNLPALEACDAGLTACEALIAQTGSVMVSSRTCGGRALSILPPAHAVIARETQLVADLEEALTLARSLHQGQWPSMLSLITGPSRTGDIERILVLGAHGPKELLILLIP